MRFKVIIFSTVLLISIFAAGCSSPETPANLPNTNSTNVNSTTGQTETNQTNTTKTNTSGPLETKPTPEIATTNEAPTLSPVYKAYCEAMNKRDEAALRKLLTKDTIKYWEKEMKAEEKTSLIEFLSEMEPIKDIGKCGARNEKIDGNTGIAEIRNENVKGFTIKFIKENGEWKITNQSPEFEQK